MPSAQPELFAVCAVCDGQTWGRGRGRLVVTLIDDGRAVLFLEDGTTRGAWLELLPDDVAWLALVLEDNARQARKVSKGFTKGGQMDREDTVQRTWIVASSTAREVNALAERLGVSPSSVVDRLLGYSLQAAQAGRLEFPVRPVRYELVGE